MTEVATQAVSAYGFRVDIAPDSGGTPGAYVELGEIRDDDLDVPEDSAVAIRFRTNQSPSGYTETVMSKAKELAEFSLSVNFVPGITLQSTVLGYFRNRTLCWVKITNAAATMVFITKAYCTKRKFEFKGEEVDRATLTFTPNGGPQTGSTFLGA
jgi:hypothetical protein